jgi:ATP-dependent Clp protease ATP-binding subunit ClpA
VLGRVGEEIAFRRLERADAARVLDPRRARLRDLGARHHGVELAVDDAAAALVLEHGASVEAGVSELGREVERLIQARSAAWCSRVASLANPRWLVTAAGGRVFVVPDDSSPRS